MDCSLIRHGNDIYEHGMHYLTNLDIVRCPIPGVEEWREAYRDGNVVLEDDNENEDEEEERVIHNYHCGITHPKKAREDEAQTEETMYYGIEIEIDNGGYSHAYAEEIMGQYHPHVMHAEHDGSLDNGFEIVTAPCTIRYHTDIDYKGICKRAVNLGYRAHDTHTAGLHIHASYQAMGSTNLERDLTVAKMLLLACRNANDLALFCRRPYNSYAQSLDNITSRRDEQALDELYEAVKGAGNRYSSLNVCNIYHTSRPLRSKTLEWRLAKGTLKYTTLMATLEMYNAMIAYCMAKTVKAVNGAKLTDIIKHVQGARLPRKNLYHYLEERFPGWKQNDWTPVINQRGEC
jgi:hypothetical protein